MADFHTFDEYTTQLELEVMASAKSLLPFVQTLQPISNYSQLLQLGPALLEKLVLHENARVNLLEHTNPAIDFHSSGHHRDRLEILQDALMGKPIPIGIYIYMHDDGGLEFNPAEVVRSLK